jgi:hypothetical protein
VRRAQCSNEYFGVKQTYDENFRCADTSPWDAIVFGETPHAGDFLLTTLEGTWTEGFHRKMKLIQRRAYGFINFSNYHLRVMDQCG